MKTSVSACQATTLLSLAALLSIVVGCGSISRSHTASPIPHGGAGAPALFEEVASRAGIAFTHSNGATGKFHFIEFSPAGCAFLDYDNDGWQDILLIQSGSSEPYATIKDRPHCALYHNNRNGTFSDVTAGSGLDRDLGYAQGIAIGDYDNDGYDDLFITSYGRNYLFHNEHGSGRFTDVTHRQGLDRPHGSGYATSAAFGDYDNDGRLDLYICYYSPWTWQQDRPCYNEKGQQDYCSPELYDADSDQLFHNEGGHFVDVSKKAGITKAKGRGLAVAFIDYNEDGRPDIFVANDLTPNMLWRNDGRGAFTEVAKQVGCAYSDEGTLMAGMGIAVADYDHSGHESLFITNFSGMPDTLYKNIGNGLFQNVSMASGLAMPHLKFLAFGCGFLDYDADGWPDLLIADGSVYIHAESRLDGASYKERKQLYHNEGNGLFREISDVDQLAGLSVPTVARGMAIGDYDNDGRQDALFNNQNGPAQLFHNLDHGANQWVTFRTVGTKSNRDGLNTHFTLSAGGMTQTATVRAGSSYLSSSDRRVYFGLGAARRIDRVEIRWPSGTRDLLKSLSPDAIYTVTEGKGITGSP